MESFESDHFAGGILPQKENAVASDRFNGTLLILLFLLYEYALSYLFHFDRDCHLLVGDCPGANAAQDNAITAFSDHE